MYYLNELLRKEGGLKDKLISAVMPQTYSAVSIKEFLDERKELTPTTTWQAIRFTIVRGWGSDLAGRSLVMLPNVGYSREVKDDGVLVNLEDVTTSFSLYAYDSREHLRFAQEQNLLEQDRVQAAFLLYDPKRDSVWLIGAYKFLETPSPDRAESSNLANLVYAFGF